MLSLCWCYFQLQTSACARAHFQLHKCECGLSKNNPQHPVHFIKRNLSLNELVWLACLQLANFGQLGTIEEQNKNKQSGFGYTDSHFIVVFLSFHGISCTIHHQPTIFFHCLPKSEATLFQALRPTTRNTDTSPGSPTTTSPTTPVSSLLYLKTVLCPWELKVRHSQQHTHDCAHEAIFNMFIFSAGKSVLPDPKVMAERFFRRQKFRPDPQGTNLMFAFMAQHFTHQFFKTNHDVQGGFTKALGHGVRLTLKQQSPHCC